MKKKLIISKTAMFIFIMIFVIIFKSVFGNENTLIGVTTITAMLMLLERDLTLNPIKNTFKFIELNLFIGIATLIASSNMWLAIPVNFISLFLISYHLCHSLRRAMYLPFSLQYLFLLVNPVSGDRIIIRLISLVVGAIFIMLLQVLFNKNRFSKEGNKILINVCDNLLKGISEIKSSNSKERNIGIIKSINSFRNMIHDKREEDYYLTEEGQIKLNISAVLEEIEIQLNKIEYKEDLDEILKDLYYFIENAKVYLDKNELLIDFDVESKKLIEKYQKLNESKFNVLEILNDIIDLSDIIVELANLEIKSYNFINKLEDIPNEFKNSFLNFKALKKNSLKFSYAIRVATGITIGAFIMDLFNLQEGRWIIFTILSLTNPLYELSQKKSKDRIIATIIGSILIIVLFDIFKDSTIRTLIIMLSGYIGSYITEYKYNMILVTVSAIGSVALMSEHVSVLSIERVLFVMVGLIISLIINRYLCIYRIEDSNNDLINLYDDLVVKMITEVHNLLKGVRNENVVRNLFIRSSLIEEKLSVNNQALINQKSQDFLEKRRLLINSVYKLYIRILKQKEYKDYFNIITESLNKSLNKNEKNLGEIIEDTKEKIKNIENVNDKLIIISVLEIISEIDYLNKSQSVI